MLKQTNKQATLLYILYAYVLTCAIPMSHRNTEGAQDFGKVSMNANVGWICDVAGEATIQLQGFTNCGEKRCGIWNDENGYEELSYVA